MAKTNNFTHNMKKCEWIGGLILLALYLLLPHILPPLNGLAGRLLGTALSYALTEKLTLLTLVIVTVLLFIRYLAADISCFFADVGLSLRTAGMGLILFYGTNELFFRLIRRIGLAAVNLNDRIMLAYPTDFIGAPWLTVLLLPLMEAVLLRALFFDLFSAKSRPVAYLFSAVLAALGAVSTVLSGGLNGASALLLASYVLPGLILAWAYDESGNALTVFILHAVLNALLLFA